MQKQNRHRRKFYGTYKILMPNGDYEEIKIKADGFQDAADRLYRIQSAVIPIRKDY